MDGRAFGKAIAALRCLRDLTQEDIERATGIPKATLATWESGGVKGMPRSERLPYLYSLLAVTDAQELIERAEAARLAGAGRTPQPLLEDQLRRVLREELGTYNAGPEPQIIDLDARRRERPEAGTGAYIDLGAMREHPIPWMTASAKQDGSGSGVRLDPERIADEERKRRELPTVMAAMSYSMEPEVEPGDILSYDPSVRTPPDGSIVVVWDSVTGDDLIKRYYRQGPLVHLVGNDHRAIERAQSEIDVQGVVVSICRPPAQRLPYPQNVTIVPDRDA